MTWRPSWPVSLALAALFVGMGGAARRADAQGVVRDDTLWSQALGTRKQLLVYLPPSYARDQDRRYPVAYYLHGFGGSERDWVSHGHLDATLDSLIARGMTELIVVMPDGDDGWYNTWNSLGNYRECLRGESPTGRPVRHEHPAEDCVPWPHYDDYLARDVVQYIDGHYRTEASSAHRAIAGLSMGGYGAISLALEYPDVWSTAASHSGVLSPLFVGTDSAGVERMATTIDQLRDWWSPGFWPSMSLVFGRDLLGWRARDPLTRLRRLLASRPAAIPAMFIDAGTDDRLTVESRVFHRALDSLHVAHHYAEWPGGHDWDYWRQHAAESLSWIASRIGK